ncbi:MAG TPA: gluconate 2-dehydrogenase subunit 3 family protein [Micropepsaceae bacterium]|nr:gluconate 2-dehydrogenase subunit 3 family protein [Micropepsaceae bacterium]
MSEKDKGHHGGADVSRRGLIKQVGLAGVGAALSTPNIAPAAAAEVPPATRREALETLNATEADTLDAIVARLIPTDENGPGATEARAAFYIDHALAGPLRALRGAYAAGLAAIDEYALASKGSSFAKLTGANQDAILSDMEKNIAPGFSPNSAAFFNLLRTHTIEGTFCDPYYGGNANFVGWNLIGYPGIRMGVTANDQRMNPKPESILKSAYDDPMFARNGGDHGH